MAEQQTIDLGIVGMSFKGDYNSNTRYEKLNVVSYNGSSYCAKGGTIGNLPTNTDYWYLLAEKGSIGETGPQGPKPVKGVDYYTAEDKSSFSGDIAIYVHNEVVNQIGDITNGSPLVAESTSGMSDTTRLYVNKSDGYVYYYNEANWVRGWSYQSSSNTEDIEDLERALGFKYYSRISTNSDQYLMLDLTDITPAIGDVLTIKMLEIMGGTIESIVLYGITENGYDHLGRIDINKITEYTFVNAYPLGIRITVVFNPRDTNDKLMSFIAGLGDKTLFYDIKSLFDKTDTINNYKNLFDEGLSYSIVERTDTSAGNYLTYNIPNSDVIENDEVTFNFLEITGGVHNNKVDIYGVTNPSTYTLIASVSPKEVSNVKIPQNFDKIRIAIYFSNLDENDKYVKLMFGKSMNSLFNYIGNLNEKYKDLNEKINNEGNSISIFRKVCCCGDSYTSGHIVDDQGVAHATNEDYAWPSYLARLTGNIYLNAGNSGANAKTWLTVSRGLPRAQSFGRVQAYTLGLMINDVSQGTPRYLELGTESDIGTNNETYYGCYSKIIRELNAISPLAKIFLFTCPKTGTLYPSYNQAVRDIYNAYKNVYPVHLIDLTEYKDNFNTPTLSADYTAGHYTATGYEILAQNIQSIISEYINNHANAFKDVAFIPYD